MRPRDGSVLCALLLVGPSGCITWFTDPMGHHAAFDDTQRQYTQYLRWGEIEKASAFVDPDAARGVPRSRRRPSRGCASPTSRSARSSITDDEREGHRHLRGLLARHVRRAQDPRGPEWYREDGSNRWLVRSDVGGLRQGVRGRAALAGARHAPTGERGWTPDAAFCRRRRAVVSRSRVALPGALRPRDHGAQRRRRPRGAAPRAPGRRRDRSRTCRARAATRCAARSRRTRMLSGTPVILVTGPDAPEDHALAIRAGADDVLAKPLSRVTLIHAVNRFLRSPVLRGLARVRSRDGRAHPPARRGRLGHGAQSLARRHLRRARARDLAEHRGRARVPAPRYAGAARSDRAGGVAPSGRAGRADGSRPPVPGARWRERAADRGLRLRAPARGAAEPPLAAAGMEAR